MAKGKLTNQQKTFAANVASGMPLGESAKDAGYSPKSASVIASKLVKNSKVVDEIARIRSKATTASLGSKAELLDVLWQTMEEARADGDRVNVVRCGELWLKATGQLVNKQEIKTDQTIDVQWSAPLPDEPEDDGDDR